MAAHRVGCQARQYSDQMCCGRCGLQWDVNDDDPPECRTEHEIEMVKIKEVLER